MQARLARGRSHTVAAAEFGDLVGAKNSGYSGFSTCIFLHAYQYSIDRKSGCKRLVGFEEAEVPGRERRQGSLRVPQRRLGQKSSFLTLGGLNYAHTLLVGLTPRSSFPPPVARIGFVRPTRCAPLVAGNVCRNHLRAVQLLGRRFIPSLTRPRSRCALAGESPPAASAGPGRGRNAAVRGLFLLRSSHATERPRGRVTRRPRPVPPFPP